MDYIFPCQNLTKSSIYNSVAFIQVHYWDFKNHGKPWKTMEKLLRLLCKRLLIQDGHAYTSPSVGCVHRQMTTWKINMNKWVRECNECRCFGTSTDVSTQQLATSHALWNTWHVLCGWAQITLIEDERGKELSDFKRWLLLRIHSQKDCLLVHFWTLIKMTSVNRVGICSQ